MVPSIYLPTMVPSIVYDLHIASICHVVPYMISSVPIWSWVQVVSQAILILF